MPPEQFGIGRLFPREGCQDAPRTTTLKTSAWKCPDWPDCGASFVNQIRMNWPDAALWPVKVTVRTALLEWFSVVNPGGGAKPVPVPVLPTSTRTCVPDMLPK